MLIYTKMSGKSKKKVLYLITKSVWAGAGKYVFDLATGLQEKQFEPVIAAGGRDILAQKADEAKIPYYEIKNFKRNVSLLKDFGAFFEVLKIIREVKPDVVHVSSPKAGGIAGAALFFYSLLITRYSLQKIFTVHGWTFNERRPRWQLSLIKTFSWLTCLFYDKIICVSEHDRKIAIGNKIAPAGKLVTIHNGIREASYKFYSRDEARKKLGLNEKSFIVGTIGEFHKNKGHRYLIEAAENLKDLEFVIIGFGEEKERLLGQISKLKITGRFTLIDDLPDAANYLKAFDVFVLPSLKEGLPYVLIEAGLAKLPIISANVGGIPEIIINQETGLLVEPMAPYELEGDIESLYKNTELAVNLAVKAREKVLKEFSFEKMFSDTLALY